MSESQYEPGVYVKGDDERLARSAADAVALSFEGYRRKEEGSESSSAASTPAPPVPVTQSAPVPDKVPTPRAPRPTQESNPS